RDRALRREVAYAPGSRIDFVLDRAEGPHFIEVKNCHLVYPDRRGYFPDSVSERAARHMSELAELARAGERASVIFTVQRPDARSIRPSDLHDPRFATEVRRAAEAGVRFTALAIRPTLTGYVVESPIPVDVRPYRFAHLAEIRSDRLRYSGWERRGKLR
ncbi:MAG: DNA/RNA nuclease SfsA, partial [Myxococcota bacterium]